MKNKPEIDLALNLLGLCAATLAMQCTFNRIHGLNRPGAMLGLKKTVDELKEKFNELAQEWHK